jgi:hypothetical protein
MRPEDIDALLQVAPFQPFRVHLKDGKSYEVLYPNLTMTTRPWLVIAFPDPESNGRWADDYVSIPWSEIASVEPLRTEGAVA